MAAITNLDSGFRLGISIKLYSPTAQQQKHLHLKPGIVHPSIHPFQSCHANALCPLARHAIQQHQISQ